MSWLPSGLTSLPGQITSFTKEVLSEGREEVDDHATELRITKTRNKELELTCSTQKSELDRMKPFIDELTVKLQAQELQMQSQVKEYRVALETKEKDIKLLKQQNADLREKFSSSSVSAVDHTPRVLPKEIKARNNRDLLFGDDADDDFHDVISAQHEINHLRNEVKRLETELGRWHLHSSSNQTNDEDISSVDGGSLVHQLQSRINDLQHQLTFEVDRHQHELSSLQDAHRQMVSALKKSHKTVVDQLQQQQKHGLAEASSADGVNMQIVDLEKLNKELMLDHEKLLEERKVERMKLDALQSESLASSNERLELVRELGECKSRLRQFEQELNQLHSIGMLDPPAASSGFMSSTPVAPSRARLRSNDLSYTDDLAEFKDLSAQNQFLDEQVRTLQSQIEKYEQELEQFELVKSDWQMEKQALEGVLKKLRQELREKEGELCIVQARKDESTDSTKQAFSADSREKEQLMAELEHERQMVKNLNMELEAVIDSTNHIHEELKAELVQKSNDLAAMESQLNARESQISELTSLLNQATSENKAAGSGESGPADVEKSNELQIQVANLEKEVKKLELERDALQKDRRQELELLLVEKNSLEESLVELDSSHQEAMSQIVKSRAEVIQTNEALKREIVQLEKRFTDEEKLMVGKIEEREKELSKYVEGDAALRTRTGELEAENVRVKEELKRNVDSVNELRSQTVQLKEKAASQDAEITRLASESDRLRLENKELLRMAKPVETDSRAGESDEDQTERLRRELESSRLDVVSLTKDLNDAKNSLATSERQVKQLTDDLEMQRSRNSPNLDGRTLESNQLQLRFNDLEQRFNEQKVLLQCTESANKEHVQTQKQLEDEINRLTRQAEDFNTSSGDMESVVKLYEAEVERLLAVEEEHLNLSSRYKDLETEMEKLRKMATIEMKEEVSEKNAGIELSKHNDIVEDYKNIVNTLENRIQSLESEVALLRETNEMKRFVEGSEMLDGEANGSEIIHSNVNSVGDCKNFEVGKQNSDVWKSSSDEDIGRLKKTVSQQEDLIKTLNSKYSSMLRLLEDRSLSAHGSTVLADFHRLESEVHVLRTEKEHMMLILNEKTREASSLKGEVHHLMSVVSAGKSALAKLQQDTQDMVRNHETSNVDMKKEAIKKLSQLVQDRDIEIEALKEKNSTLLQVLQSSSPDAATRELSSLIEERDNLQRQVAAYQNDREQIISTLQVKHQESVSYYAEIERLSSFVSELTEQKERLERNLSNLTSQYEDKQKSLVKALNDFSNYKQKFFEVERRYNELQERLKCENGNSDVDAGKQTGGSLSYHQPMALDVETMKQDYEKLLTEQNSQILDLGKRLAELEQLLREKERHVSSKEQELSALSVKLHLSEASISAKDSELNSARKQCENLAFQLQGVTNERAELTGELDELRRRCESLSSDVQLTRQTNNAMTVSLSNKDLKINTLQEKVLSLDSIVQQRSEDSASGDNAQLEHLVKEVETLRSHGLLLQQDRDHLYLAILQFQAENTELKTELQRLREKEQRLAKECDRLRGHLLVIEEGHTREAIESEEREKDLRNRLATVEEKALSSSAAVVNARSDASRQLDNLQIQLHTIAEQRDDALLQLANAQETISSYANSLTNLQMVLEQFQAERHSHQVAEVEHYKKAVDAERAENKRLQSQLDQIEKQLQETVEALGAAERLSEQIDRKESMIAALREEVVLRENELSKVEMELKNVTSSVEAKVDKVIVKNLLRGYFHAPTSKRTEALQVIGQILSFTKEEMKEITGDSYGTSSWIGGFFRKTPPPLTKSSQSHTQSLNESFSQLFVKFLEQESAPHQQMRLPAELMVKEQQERRQQQRPLAFNPFSATVDPAMPLTLPALSDKTYQSPLLSGASAGGSSSQLLLGPASSQRLPIFAPAATRADTPVQGMTSSSQGRDAGVTSSGHSTPSGSGSILRDILQQR